MTNESLLFQGVERGQGFIHDLVVVSELDVVALDQVEIVDPQADEAVLNAAFGARFREIVVATRFAIAADFRGEVIAIASHALERATEIQLGERATVSGRNVDEIDPTIEGGMDGGDTVVDRDPAENSSQ